MKNIFQTYIGVILFTAVLFTSCTDFLEVAPKMELSSETALTTTTGLQTAIIGCYDRLQGSYLYGGGMWTAGEMLAENVQRSGKGSVVYEEIQMLEKNMTADNLISCSQWQNGYWVINQANLILQAIPGVEASGDIEIVAQKDRIMGEALFLRAIMHFEMMRYFQNTQSGEGIPLLTAPTGVDGKPARATMDDLYVQVIKDLEDAATLLSESGKNSGRATTWAAKAFLAKLYFNNNDFANAELLANEVVVEAETNNTFALEDSMPIIYAATPSKEFIFTIIGSETDGVMGTLNGYYRFESSGKFSPSTFTIKVLTSEGIKDKRLQLLLNIDGKFYTKKFDQRFGSVGVIRLAEMYLIRGESRLANGDTPGAIADINKTRLRAGLNAKTTVNYNDFYYERFKELCFEGDNFHNQRRLEKTNIAGYNWDSGKLMFKVPQRERDVNPNLTQNPYDNN
jgi:hypothetical protein